MKRILTFLLILNSCLNIFGQEVAINFPKLKTVEYSASKREWFVKYAQFQIRFELEPNKTTGLLKIKDTLTHFSNYLKCLDNAKANNVKVLIFPELSLELSEMQRKTLIGKIQQYSNSNDAVIIAGSYFDKDRHNKLVVVMPNGVFESYKIRQSKFEAGTEDGKGMVGGDTLYFFKTKYGNFLPITCVDLISDDIQYIARNLSNQSYIDILINITYNPASWEFMREASAIVNRHPIFISITNVANPTKEQVEQPKTNNCTDNGYLYGNTSVFSSVSKDLKSSYVNQISDCFKTFDFKTLHPAYSMLMRQINPELIGVLSYELNLRLIRQPENTNAPDQGYPTIRNIVIKKLDFK